MLAHMDGVSKDLREPRPTFVDVCMQRLNVVHGQLQEARTVQGPAVTKRSVLICFASR